MKKLFLFMAFLLGMTATTVAQTAANILDIANYASIDEVGWDNEFINNLYQFNVDEANQEAWLTVSVAGAYFNSSYWGSNYPNRKQAWIRLIPNPTTTVHHTVTGYSWNAVGKYRSGSAAFFDNNTTYSYGFNNSSSNTSQKYQIRFYVTNTNKVRLYGNTGNGTSNYKTRIQIYSINDNGSLHSLGVKDFSTNKKDFEFISTEDFNLDVNVKYVIDCTTYRGRFYEISFCTPYQSEAQPEITASPDNLTFETTVGTPVTQTFNVQGTDLQDDITATITDDNGNAFSVPATISQADASATGGTNVTVTFDPSEAGNYTGTLTLSSTGAADVTIPLTGTATYEYFPLTITTAGLATLYLDYPVKIPYDEYEPNILGVYYVYALNGKEMLQARLDNTIPANTGVIVQGNSGTYNFPRVYEADPLPSNAPNSLLRGCVEVTPVETVLADYPNGRIYTLGRSKSNYINFYWYTGTTLGANKAYFLIEDANGAKELTMRFDDEATGIRTATTLVEEGTWYTLQGIRLQGQPVTKGLYIHNGKTVVVK